MIPLSPAVIRAHSCAFVVKGSRLKKTPAFPGGERASIQLMEFIEKEDMRYLYYATDPRNVPLCFASSEICFGIAHDPGHDIRHIPPIFPVSELA